MHHRSRTLDGRAAKRILIVPAVGLALTLGAAPAQATPGKKQCTASKAKGKAADHRPAGVGGGRRIR
jgi:hypothetical protein